jgi:hypothetical protein
MLLVPQAREAPLTDLARRMRPALVSYFLRRVRDPSEAEDLAHEVFLRLAGTRLDSLRSADAYVFQIAANLLNDRARRNKVREDYVYSVSASDARARIRLTPESGLWPDTLFKNRVSGPRHGWMPRVFLPWLLVESPHPSFHCSSTACSRCSSKTDLRGRLGESCDPLRARHGAGSRTVSPRRTDRSDPLRTYR